MFRDLERAYANSHLERLTSQTMESIETSSLHLDLICDLRRDGEVYADGELIWRAGSFVREPQAPTTTREPERV